MAGMIMNFPENTRAVPQSLLEQAMAVEDEARELLAAIIAGEPRERILEECWDVVQAAEGVLRKFPVQEAAAARDFVEDKCRRRGNYR